MGPTRLSNDLNCTRTQKSISTVHSVLLDSSVGFWPAENYYCDLKRLQRDLNRACAATQPYSHPAHVRERRPQCRQSLMLILSTACVKDPQTLQNSTPIICFCFTFLIFFHIFKMSSISRISKTSYIPRVVPSHGGLAETMRG